MTLTNPHLVLDHGEIMITYDGMHTDEGLDLVTEAGCRIAWGKEEVVEWEQLGIETDHEPYSRDYRPEATSLRKAINKAGIDFPQEIR